MQSLEIDRIAPGRRPQRPLAGYHTWTDLAFLHWRAPADEIQRLLPDGLSVDTFDGDAWVGLVPFYMSRIRPWWFPAVPGLSWFCETNVRTYVHREGRDPGVWFFSLDASNSIAVRTARLGWRLPYYRAEMSLVRSDNRVEYSSRRLWPGSSGASSRIVIETGPLLGSGTELVPLSSGTELISAGTEPVPFHGRCLPGTLEHFLIERYILYASPVRHRLLIGQVFHTPYPVRTARLVGCEQSLTAALGLGVSGPPCHTAFSDGVQVEIFPLRSCVA